MLGFYKKNQRTYGYALLWLFFCVGLNACTACGADPNAGFNIEPLFLEPSSSATLSGRTLIRIGFTDDSVTDEVQQVEVFATLQGSTKRQLIASLFQAPFQFRWDTNLRKDGRYQLQIVASDSRSNPHPSATRLVRVLNSPPKVDFLNCSESRVIRGVFHVIVDMETEGLELKQKPILRVNGTDEIQTIHPIPKFVFPVDTTQYSDSTTLTLTFHAIDTLNNVVQKTCRPIVDNTPPTVRFRSPVANKDGVPVGRNFTTTFHATDNNGVKEVRLWVDESRCPDPKPSSNDHGCELSTLWSGTNAPLFSVPVKLSQRYEQKDNLLLVYLKARAIDHAGNESTPISLQVWLDSKPPEVFIFHPGPNEVIHRNDSSKFSLQVKDNWGLQSVKYFVEDGTKIIPFPRGSGNVGSNRKIVSLSEPIVDPYRMFGAGKRVFVVEAIDRSGNITTIRRPFHVGCIDGTDCEFDQVCHNTECIIPAGRDQVCGPLTPCAPGTTCIESAAKNESFCSNIRQGYCRVPCNPGNRYIEPQSCHSGFYCSRDERACLPGDGCNPATNTGCPSNHQCVLKDSDAAICLTVGSQGQGESCQNSCSSQNSCQAGLWCTLRLSTLKRACRRKCSQTSDCPSGHRCSAIQWSFGGGSTLLGACVESSP